MTHEYIERAGGKIYAEAAGEGEALVLVHAGIADSRMWDDQWAAFAAAARVIRFDLRGHGKSDPADGPVDRRADLAAVLDRFDVARATLVGCSLGGELIIDFALEHPERVAALVLVSTVPGGFEMQGEPPAELFEMFGAIEQGDLERASELQNRIWVDGPFRQPAQVDPSVRERAAAMNRIGLANGSFGLEDARPLAQPAAQRLGELGMPALIIAGALDHPEILRAAGVMEAQIAGARAAILPDSAHLPNMEQPALFNEAVLGFVRAPARQAGA